MELSKKVSLAIAQLKMYESETEPYYYVIRVVKTVIV